MNLGERMKQVEAKDRLEDRVFRSMTNQTPNEAQIKRIEKLRGSFKLTTQDLIEVTPISREQSLAITKMEEALMWAVKAIVLEGDE